MSDITLMDQADADDMLELTDEMLTTPGGKLSVLLAEQIAGSDPTAQSPFIPILIELLPILADLLGRFCEPTEEQLFRSLRSKRPLVRRFNERRINTWTIQSQGGDTYRALGGRDFGGDVITVLGAADNEALVKEALASPAPAPIWSAF